MTKGTVIGDGCVSSLTSRYVGKRPKLSPRSTAKGGALEPLDDRIAAARSAATRSSWPEPRSAAACIVGDNAGIRERCTIGDRRVVGRSVTVENDTTIGARTKIQTGAYITAYVTIEDDVFIAPMVVTTNDNYMGRTEKRFEHLKGCTIRRGARVGGGAHILPGIEIGAEAFVATASVVTRDVEPGMVVMGVPAVRSRSPGRRTARESVETRNELVHDRPGSREVRP